jgi:cellulose biosynthesis protein BcsQ
MAAVTPPDDISTLMTRVHLDGSTYKVFEGRRTAAIDSGAPARTAFQPVAKMEPRPLAPAAKMEPRPHTPAAKSGSCIQECARQENTHQAPLRPRWNVLNSLLGVGRKDEAAGRPEALRVPLMTFSAGAGGVGKTTILSTLARLLCGMGESIFLIYSDSQRTLPLHFGGKQVVPGRVRTSIPATRDLGQLHLYSRSQDESGMAEEVDSWLPREVNALAAEVGRVLGEITNEDMSEQQMLGLASINLRVIVPDITSVLTVTRELAEEDDDPDSPPTFYLLNKYDPTVAFHKDVRERLEMALGERLLPFSIRRTDLIPEALAAGSTVVDYAPDAPVVEDFEKLARWVRDAMVRNEIAPARSIV